MEISTSINGRELKIDRVRLDKFDAVRTARGWVRLEGYRTKAKAIRRADVIVHVEHVWTSYKGSMNERGERDRVDVTVSGRYADMYASEFAGGKIVSAYNDVRHIVATF